jgi:hypothetical protein
VSPSFPNDVAYKIHFFQFQLKLHQPYLHLQPHDFSISTTDTASWSTFSELLKIATAASVSAPVTGVGYVGLLLDAASTSLRYDRHPNTTKIIPVRCGGYRITKNHLFLHFSFREL